jgi:hypothetical protein
MRYGKVYRYFLKHIPIPQKTEKKKKTKKTKKQKKQNQISYHIPQNIISIDQFGMVVIRFCGMRFFYTPLIEIVFKFIIIQLMLGPSRGDSSTSNHRSYY